MCENREDLDALISSVSKLILIEENTLLKKELQIEDSPTKSNADHGSKIGQIKVN